MAQAVASTAAKASYLHTMPTTAQVHPTYTAAKKDPKLANNWKTKPAEELTDALIVNPYSREELSDAIKRALTMPREERIRKWKALMQVVRDTDVGIWRDSYVGALRSVDVRADDDVVVSAELSA